MYVGCDPQVFSVADVVQFRNTGKHGIVVQGPHNGEFKVKWSSGDTSGWIDGQSLSAPTTEGIRIVSWLTWCKKDAFAKCEGKIGRVMGDPTLLEKAVRLEWADPEGGEFSSDRKKACELEPCSKADFDRVVSLVKEYQDDIKAAGASTLKEYKDILKAAGASTLEEYKDIKVCVCAREGVYMYVWMYICRMHIYITHDSHPLLVCARRANTNV